MAAQTGGEYRKVDGTEDLIVSYSIIADKILKQQVLLINAGFKGDGRNYSLEIQYQSSNGETAIAKILFNAPILMDEKPTKEPVKEPVKKKDCCWC